MYYVIVPGVNFYKWLWELDQERAEQTRAEGCACGWRPGGGVPAAPDPGVGVGRQHHDPHGTCHRLSRGQSVVPHERPSVAGIGGERATGAALFDSPW